MYRPESSNADADGLSRLPGLLGKNNVSNINTEFVKVICNIQHVQLYVQCLSVKTADEPPLPNRHMVDVNAEQKRDNFMTEWAYSVEEHRKPTKEQLERNPHNTWFINNFEKFKLIDGILYRVINTNGELVRQLVLPETCIASHDFTL